MCYSSFLRRWFWEVNRIPQLSYYFKPKYVFLKTSSDVPCLMIGRSPNFEMGRTNDKQKRSLKAFVLKNRKKWTTSLRSYCSLTPAMEMPVVGRGSWKLIHGQTVLLWLGSSITSCGPPISRPPWLVSAVGYTPSFEDAACALSVMLLQSPPSDVAHACLDTVSLLSCCVGLSATCYLICYFCSIHTWWSLSFNVKVQQCRSFRIPIEEETCNIYWKVGVFVWRLLLLLYLVLLFCTIDVKSVPNPYCNAL